MDPGNQSEVREPIEPTARIGLKRREEVKPRRRTDVDRYCWVISIAAGIPEPVCLCALRNHDLEHEMISFENWRAALEGTNE